MARIRSIKQKDWFGQQQPWTHGCSLYVVAEKGTGLVKVGIAEHPLRRLSGLQGGNPRVLTLLAVFCGDRRECRTIEAAVLKKFDTFSVRGEWLDVSASLVVAAISSLTEAA